MDRVRVRLFSPIDEMGLGKMGLGELGLGEMGQNPLYGQLAVNVSL